MRKTMLAMAAAAAILVPAAGAIAQSGQGGYLGSTPGGAQTGTVVTPRPADLGTQAPSPAAWCSNSTVSGRCMKNSEADHDWCQQHDAEHYERCRRALDSVGAGWK